MTLGELLPLARSLGPDERMALAEEMMRSVEGAAGVDAEVLDLVEARAEHILAHLEETIEWEDFEAAMDAELGPIPG